MANKNIYGFSDWDNAFLSQSERNNITRQRQRAEAGEISWKEANDYAEGLRAKYGYAGGNDGSDYIIKPQEINTTYDGSSKEREIDSQEKRLQEMTYDKFTQGNEYAELLDKYTKAGNRAMEDTVGSIAARTGGMASSYAAAAGTEAFNRYMEGLSEESRALYEQEYAREKERLMLLKDEENQAYQRFLDNIGLQKTERDHNLQVGGQILQKKQYEDEVARTADNTAWERGITEEELQFKKDDISKTDAAKAQQVAQEQALYMLQNGLATYEELLEKEPDMVQLAKDGGWTENYMRSLMPQVKPIPRTPYLPIGDPIISETERDRLMNTPETAALVMALENGNMTLEDYINYLEDEEKTKGIAPHQRDLLYKLIGV